MNVMVELLKYGFLFTAVNLALVYFDYNTNMTHYEVS